jgi:hypothetical protein
VFSTTKSYADMKRGGQGIRVVVKKPHVFGLFKNVRLLGAQKIEREAYMDIR